MPDPELESLRSAAERARAAAESNTFQYAEGESYYSGRAAYQRSLAQLARLQPQIAAMEAAGKRERQKIGLARRQLGIADESHAEVVRRVTAGRSASTLDCTATERAAILAEYQAKGFRPTKPRRVGRAPSAEAMDRQTMLKRVEQLLTTLKLPWGYAEAIVRQQRGIPDKRVACPLEAVTDIELKALIAALYRHQHRQRAKT